MNRTSLTHCEKCERPFQVSRLIPIKPLAGTVGRMAIFWCARCVRREATRLEREAAGFEGLAPAAMLARAAELRATLDSPAWRGA